MRKSLSTFIPYFYADFSICPKPRAAPVARPRRAPKVNRLLRTLELNSNSLFSNPPNPPSTLPVHDVIHIPRSYLLSGIFILDFRIGGFHLLQLLNYRFPYCIQLYTWSTLDRAKHWRIRRLKESAHMLGYNDLLNRPSIELNIIWELIIKKTRWKKKKQKKKHLNMSTGKKSYIIAVILVN